MEKIFFPLHIISLCFVAWTVFSADHMGFNWIRGKTQKLNKNKVAQLHKYTWIGLGLMIFTGSVLFWQDHTYYLGRVQFFIKMSFVVTLIINGLVIGTVQKVAINNGWKDLTFKQRLPLLITGGISTLAWFGAFTAAFFLNEF